MNVPFVIFFLVIALVGFASGETLYDVVKAAKKLKVHILNGFGGACGRNGHWRRCLTEIQSAEDQIVELERHLSRIKGILRHEFGPFIPEAETRELLNANRLLKNNRRAIQKKKLWLLNQKRRH